MVSVFIQYLTVCKSEVFNFFKKLVSFVKILQEKLISIFFF